MKTTQEKGLTKNAMIAALTKSSHGSLGAYVEAGRAAFSQDPEFGAHLIAWNNKVGQIRDSKTALPIVSLGVERFPESLIENSLAHLALLDPRNLLKALAFSRKVGTPRHGRALRRLTEQYLRAREANWSWWERTALSHRESMKGLYATYHVKPAAMADQILFKGDAPNGTVFHAVKTLPVMSASEAAGTVIERRIPFLVAIGALGPRMKDPDVMLALIERMSPAELVTNTKMLERFGVKTIPALRAAFEQGLQKVATSKKGTFKTTRAAEAMTDEGLKEKLRGTQEKQIKALGGVDGNWLVLGDKSGSMEHAIEVSRRVTATLAKMVKGEVHLVFFDTSPRYIDATGKDYDALLDATKLVSADGATSIGCGLQYVLEKGIEVDGIAIVSDAEENRAPVFVDVYKKYAARFDKEPPVYLYHVHLTTEQRRSVCLKYGAQYMTEDDTLSPAMERAGIALQTFDLGSEEVDYYSLPNIVQTMRANRYSLVDEIMAVPLLTLKEALTPAAMARA